MSLLVSSGGGGGPITASDITDSSASGRTVLTGTAEQARAAIGVNPLNLVSEVDRRMWTTAGLSANLFFHGSSTTGGGTAPALNSTELPLDGYANYAARHLGATPLVGWSKRGNSGVDITSFIDEASQYVDPFVVQGRTNILYVQGAKNWLQAGNTPALWISNFKTYCAARKQAGWNRIYLIIPSFPIYAYQTMNGSMPAFVSACLSDYTLWDGTYSDGIIRWDAVPYLHDSSRTTAEGLHPNTGYNSVAGPSLAKQTLGLTLNSNPITVAITSPASGGTVTTDATVTFTTNASTTTGYVARLYAGVETTISGGLNESLSLISTASNVTSLSLPVAKLPIGTTNLYVIIEETFGRIGTSAKLPVALSFSPVVQTSPANVSIASGGMAIFTAAVAASPTATLAWQVSTDGGSTWSNVSNNATYAGVATQELTVMATAGLNGYKYRLHVSNGLGSADTSSATLTVSGTVTTYFQDTFPTTGSWTTGTRTPTIGNTWSLNGGSWVFDSGGYAAPGSSTTISNFNVGASAYRCRSTFQWTSSTNADMALWIPHYQDNANRYKVFLNGGVIIRLDKQINTNYPKAIDSATVSFATGADHQVDVLVSPTNISLFIDRIRYASMPVDALGTNTTWGFNSVGTGFKFKDPIITSA